MRIRLVVALLVAAVAAEAQEIRFTTARAFPIAGIPADLLITDTNDDQLPDLLVPSIDQGVLGVLRNEDDGNFNPLPDVQASLAPTKLAAADFDNSGTLDLVVSETESDFIYIMRGNGDGTFSDVEPLGTEHDPAGVRIADMNEDDIDDIVVTLAGEAGGGVTVHLGNGNGTFDFDPERGRRLSGGAYGVQVGDFNGDDHLDVAAAVTNGTIGILLGDGEGNLGRVTEFEAGSELTQLVAFDFDGDDQLDVLTADGSDDALHLLRGDGEGGLGEPSTIPAPGGPASVRLTNMNGDAIPDVVTANTTSGDVSVFLGLGGGTFGTPRHFLAPTRPFEADAADVDGDGRLDLVAASQTDFGGAVNVLLGTDDGFEGIEALLPASNLRGVVPRDLDGDGLPELVTSAAARRSIEAVGRDPLTGVYLPPRTLIADIAAGPLELGDLDGDGRSDVVTTVDGQPDVLTALATADGGFGAPRRTELAGPSPVFALADLDGDGHLDFVGPSTIQPALSVLFGKGDGTFEPLVDIAIAGQPSGVTVGHFDADERLDIAVGNGRQNTITLLLGQPDRQFQAASPIATTSAPLTLASADLDADGNQDLAFAGVGGARLLFGDGNGAFTPGATLSSPGLVPELMLRDLNGDLRPDVLMVNTISNAMVAYANSGSRSVFAGPVNVAVGLRPFAIGAADLDGDGRYEALPVGGAIWVVKNATEATTQRGDANRDGARGAADLLALLRELPPSGARPIEDLFRDGRAGLGADANGDGLLDQSDLDVLPRRLFSEFAES